MKHVKNNSSLYKRSKILDRFSLNDREYDIELNQQDKNLQTEEHTVYDLIKNFKELYKDIWESKDPILNIPEPILQSNGMFSFSYKKKNGIVVRRIARKLSDGSYVFAN